MQGSSNDLHAAAAATEPLGRIADLLAHLRIRTRIGALMLLAALVAALLAAMGIRGLAASKESLRVVYEDRMEPVRSLSQISHLMLANQLQMQLALARANPQGGIVRLEHISAWQAAEQIEQNVAAIDELWHGYLAVARSTAEQALVQQFGERWGATCARPWHRRWPRCAGSTTSVPSAWRRTRTSCTSRPTPTFRRW